MANILAKRGNQDNIVTYEHVCDTYADMTNIDKKQINLGSTCLVLRGKSGNVEIYMADTKKRWTLLSSFANSSSGGGSGDIPSDAERLTEEEIDEMLNGGSGSSSVPSDSDRLTEEEIDEMLNN